VDELVLVVQGGFTEEGERIEPINLVPDARIAEYYFTYGLALARLSRCREALQVAQMIQARVPSDELAVGNAVEIENRCRLNLTSVPTIETTDTDRTKSVIRLANCILRVTLSSVNLNAIEIQNNGYQLS
jgi:hypothetical protein